MILKIEIDLAYNQFAYGGFFYYTAYLGAECIHNDIIDLLDKFTSPIMNELKEWWDTYEEKAWWNQYNNELLDQ